MFNIDAKTVTIVQSATIHLDAAQVDYSPTPRPTSAPSSSVDHQYNQPGRKPGARPGPPTPTRPAPGRQRHGPQFMGQPGGEIRDPQSPKQPYTGRFGQPGPRPAGLRKPPSQDGHAKHAAQASSRAWLRQQTATRNDCDIARELAARQNGPGYRLKYGIRQKHTAPAKGHRPSRTLSGPAQPRPKPRTMARRTTMAARVMSRPTPAPVRPGYVLSPPLDDLGTAR